MDNQNSSVNIIEQFNNLYDKYYSRLLAWFRRNADYDDAEDLTQQTFAKMWVWLGTNQSARNEKALIFTVAKNVRNDYFRKKAAQFECVSITEEMFLADNADFSSEIELRIFLQTLSIQDKQLIEMKRRGYSSREIGRVLGISGSAVRTRLQQIHKKIGRLMD